MSIFNFFKLNNFKMSNKKQMDTFEIDPMNPVDELATEEAIIHDLKMPMNGIVSMVQLLKAMELTEEQHQCVQIIEESSHSVLSLIEVLKYPEQADTKGSINPAKMEIRSLIEDVYIRNSVDYNSEGFKLNYRIEESFPTFIVSDRAKISELIHCILEKLSRISQSHITIDINNKAVLDVGHYLNLIISNFEEEDSGEEEYIELYDKDSESLRTIHSLIRAFGGTVTITAVDDHHQKYDIVIPYDNHMETMTLDVDGRDGVANLGQSIPDDTANEGLAPAGYRNHDYKRLDMESDTSQKKKIMVVEDEVVGRITLKLTLRDRYDVVFAKNGKEAVELYFAEKPDLVLMDIMMPIMNGFEAFDEIEKKDLDRVPIVACTSKVISSDRDYLISYGFDEFLAKPIDMERLFQILDKYL